MQQRLFELTLLLIQQGSATAAQLAERFGVSRRTIYRDIDALSSAGVPVYTEPGKGGGIHILPGYALDKALLSKEEQAQLMAHVSGAAQLGAPDTQALLDKLGALFGRSESWLEVSYAPWGGGEETRSLFRQLRDAILRRQVLCFAYLGGNRPQATQRQAEPYRIIFRGQGWYLQAFCRTRQDWRFFKLSRMRDVATIGGLFTPRPVPPQAAVTAPGPATHVRLRLAPALAFRAVDEFTPAQLTPTPDGGFLVDCHFQGDTWLLGYLLSLGPQAEVLEPAWLRCQLADTLEQMAALYHKEK